VTIATAGGRSVRGQRATQRLNRSLDQDGRPRFNDLLFGRGDPVYIVFDLLFYEREDIRSLPLKERRYTIQADSETARCFP
jgi:hypothetical protein